MKTKKVNELEVVFPGQLELETQEIEVVQSDVGFSGFENLQELTNNYELYVSLTEKTKRAVTNIFDNYLKIGKSLLEVKEKELYKIAGFENIFDYAQENFELSKTTVNNVTSIVLKFCDENGYLLDEFEGYTYSTLVEMVSVKQLDLKNYTPTMTVKEVRLQKVVDEINEQLELQFGELGFITEIINYVYSVDFNKKFGTTSFEVSHKITKDKYEDKLNFKIDFTLSNKITKQKIYFELAYSGWRKSLRADSYSFNYGQHRYFSFQIQEISSLTTFKSWLTKFQNELVKSDGAIKVENSIGEKVEKQSRAYDSIAEFVKVEDEYREAPVTFFTNILAEKFNNHFLEIPNQREIHVYKESKMSKKNPPAFKIINYRNPLELKVQDALGNEFKPANIEELFAKEVNSLLDKLKS